MELDPSVALWTSRQGGAAAVDASAVSGADGSRLVLVTTRAEVLEFDAASRKCVNHWPFRAGGAGANALTLGAVRHPSSRALFGVRGGGKKPVVLSWRNADLDVNKWKRAPLQSKSPPVALLVHPQLADAAVVVFANGAFAAFDENLTRVLGSEAASVASGVVEPADEAESSTVIWASLNADHRNPSKGRLYLSVVSKVGTQYELVVHQLLTKKDRDQVDALAATLCLHHVVANAEEPTDALASCAFHADQFSYSLVWSSGRWEMLRLSFHGAGASLEVVATQQVAALSANEDAQGSKKKRKLSSAAAIPDSAAFTSCSVGPFSYLLVSSAQSPTRIAGWDAKFAVQVAESSIESQAADDSEGVDAIQINQREGHGRLLALRSSLHGEMVLAVYERAVLIVNVKNKHSTLASVLGASTGPLENGAALPPAPGQPTSAVSWEDVAAKKLDVEGWSDAVCGGSAHEQQLLSDLADPTVTKTTAQFVKKHKEAVKALGERSFRLTLAVARRCVGTPELALWTPLKTAIESKRLSARAVPALLPTLMQHDQFALLEAAIVNLTDIDERSVVRLLKYFVRKSGNAALASYVADQSKSCKHSKAAEPTQASERFVVALLGLPTNSVFLHHAIRELDINEVLFVLAVCKKFSFALSLLDTNATAATPTPTKKRGRKSENSAAPAVTPTFQAFVDGAEATTPIAPLPSSTQFCSWICALLDGHFAPLVLAAAKNPAVAAGVEQLQTMVLAQLRACSQFEAVQSVLSNFLSGVKLPQAHGVPDYCIEELRI